jgi:periplasmic divalent cation tolerance protein
LFTDGYLVVLSTCPDTRAAENIARILLDAGLAACVNILPGVRSMYVWKGSLQSEAEVLMLIKTAAANFDRLSETLVAVHPYELPEVVALEIVDGHHPYLQWLADPRK